MKICIDPGHGGTDPGAVGRCGDQDLCEHDIALQICLSLEELLLEQGHLTYLTRRVDRNLSLPARTQFANRYQADLFISIHCNAAYQPTAAGIETWIHPFSNVGRQYATPIQKSLTQALSDHKNRGVKEADFHVLRETAMPAVLVETEFISNPEQAEFLAKGENQRRIAQAIAEGISQACLQPAPAGDES
ncbi:MAG: N-acetylmuramoyl-L-alanine amidase [Proteobacteria bacterium]|nr:N-acetylmuramoyl-L-alanine amidase [Pseudomonadota bacterium]MBU1057191.1 N-acetylmuramoyl-L-alanine amidase [Pseudomonadota bacterium]